jgi:hypothetical protein
MQRDQDRRAADGSALGPVHRFGRFDHETGGVQLADDRGNGRRSQCGTACKVRARHGADLSQHPDDARPGVATGRPFHRVERYTPIAPSTNSEIVRS